MSLIERTVSVKRREPPAPYYFVRQKDYVSILAMTPDGKIPLVRQYRPAAGRITLELPAGTIDAGQTPESTCRKELLEETGLRAGKAHFLGTYFCDTGRLGNRIHNFFVETLDRRAATPRMAELDVRFVSIGQFIQLCVKGRFDLQLHLGTAWLSLLHPRSAWIFRTAERTKRRR